MAITIKLSTLKRKRACTPQLALFERAFGKEVVVTYARAEKYADQFDWGWTVRVLLPRKLHKEWGATIEDANMQLSARWRQYTDEYYAGKITWDRRVHLERLAMTMFRKVEAREFVRLYRKHNRSKVS